MSAMVIDWFFFFFKQKTAYEMRISDWSSDVCSSDLPATAARLYEKLISDDNVDLLFGPWGSASAATAAAVANKHKRVFLNSGVASEQIQEDRKSVVSGKSVSVSVDLGGRRFIKKKKQHIKQIAIYSRCYNKKL